MTAERVGVLPATRLRVLTSLPRQHQDYFFEVIRSLCARHIALASRNDPRLDRDSEALELFSEVSAKLLGLAGTGAGRSDEHEGGGTDVLPPLAASADPKRDGRVSWLIDQTGGRHALTHRYEDIRRRRHGGKWRGDGYRQVQLQAEHVDVLSVDPDDPHHEDDMRRVWRGLLAMAKSEFTPDADVSTLLNLMARDSEIQAGFGTEWPITQIVNALNQHCASPPWVDDRVENAKKRLTTWIARLKRNHGLNADDLMALFARHGRTLVREAPSPSRAHSAPAANKTASREVGS
jgi:hypothetical protein